MLMTHAEADAAANRLLARGKLDVSLARAVVANTLGYGDWQALSAALVGPCPTHAEQDFASRAQTRFYNDRRVLNNATFTEVFLPPNPPAASEMSMLSVQDAIRLVSRRMEPYSLMAPVEITPASSDHGMEDVAHPDDLDGDFYTPPLAGTVDREGLVVSYLVSQSDGLEPAEMEVLEWSVTARLDGVIVASASGDAYSSVGARRAVAFEDAIGCADMVSDRDVTNIRELYKAGHRITKNSGIATVEYLQVPPALRGNGYANIALTVAAEKLREYRPSITKIAYDPVQLVALMPFPEGHTFTEGSARSLALTNLLSRFQAPIAASLAKHGCEVIHAEIGESLGPTQVLFMIGGIELGHDLLADLPPEEQLDRMFNYLPAAKSP